MTNPLLYLPSISGALLGLGLAWVAVTRRPGGGWGHMIALGLGIAWWCAGQAFWLGASTLEQALLINRVQYLAIVMTPLFWFWLTLTQTGHSHWLRLPRGLLFGVVPVIILGAAWLVEPGGGAALWREIRVPPEVPVPRVTYGPLFLLLVLHSYGLFLSGCILLIGRYSQSPHYRVQLFATGIFPIALVPMNAMFISGNWPLPVDPTPVAFAAGCTLVLWAMLRHRLLDLAPVGRTAAFDSLNEGVLILDARERVVDINDAACRLLELDPRRALGLRLEELLPGVTVAAASGACPEQRMRAAAGAERFLQPAAAPIRETEAAITGTVVTLRDTTREREAQIALRLAQQRLEQVNAELERMAHSDALTGLANRRLLLTRLDEEIARAQRSGAPLALLMIDLDDFKQVNDSRGHLAGDAVLEAAGALLRSLKRPADVAARYGGEELSLLLTDTDEAGARAAATRVRLALRALTHRDTAGASFRITTSVGVALLQADETSANELINRADAALYAAKKAGRDRVAIAAAGGIEMIGDAELGALAAM
jgi:diguanylate cyclase (GGDEF)-like protein